MSRQAVSRDLYSLMPGYTTSLPTELVDLTHSLLAQSRSKAANLKQDEEIARGYVCANIACERLKRSLDLPDIIPRPPVHQRTYKKVYQYLNSTLSALQPRQTQRNNTAPSTPSKGRKSASATPQTNRSGRQIPNTPSKTVLPHRSPNRRTAQTAQSNKKGRQSSLPQEIAYITSKTPDLDLPVWIMQAIRAVCAAWAIPPAAPHIFAGVSSVARMLASSTSSAGVNAAMPSKERKSAPSSRPDSTGKFPLQLIPSLAFTVAIYTDTQFDQAPEAEDDYSAKRTEVYNIFARHMPRGRSKKRQDPTAADDDDDHETDELAYSDDDRAGQISPHEIEEDIANHGLLLPKHTYEDLCEEYNALAADEWLDMQWYANVRTAAMRAKEDALLAEEDAMDVDSDVTSSSSSASTSVPASQRRKRKRKTSSQQQQHRHDELTSREKRRNGTNPGEHDHEHDEAKQDRNRQGGEMMLARVGWADDSASSARAYDKWAARARRRIATKRRELAELAELT